MRIVLALLAAFHLAWGVPAVIAARWFFDHFPGLGHQWTAAYPPFNEHLMTDVGAAATTLGVLLAIAAAVNDVKVTRTVLAGVILFSGLHLGYHVARHGSLHGTELVLSLASLALGVAIPSVLLVMTRRTRSPQDQRA